MMLRLGRHNKALLLPSKDLMACQLRREIHCLFFSKKLLSQLVWLAAKYDKEILSHIEPFVYEWTADKKGSISAEHGLGQMKPECIRCCLSMMPC